MPHEAQTKALENLQNILADIKLSAEEQDNYGDIERDVSIAESLLESICSYIQNPEKENTLSTAADIMCDECVKNKAKEWGEWDAEVDGKKFLIRIQLDSVPKFETLMKEHREMREALENLSKLGNGNQPGNSEGNVIAQKALSSLSK